MPFTVIERFDVALLPGNCSVSFYREPEIPTPTVHQPPQTKLPWGAAAWFQLPDGAIRIIVSPLPNEYDFALAMFMEHVADGAEDDVGDLADWLLALGVPVDHAEHHAFIEEREGHGAFATLSRRIAEAMKKRKTT